MCATRWAVSFQLTRFLVLMSAYKPMIRNTLKNCLILVDISLNSFGRKMVGPEVGELVWCVGAKV